MTGPNAQSSRGAPPPAWAPPVSAAGCLCQTATSKSVEQELCAGGCKCEDFLRFWNLQHARVPKGNAPHNLAVRRTPCLSGGNPKAKKGEAAALI